MSSGRSEENEPELTPEELDEQSGELLPDREAMPVIEGPLRGPMPLTEPGPPGEAPMNPLAPVGGEVIQPTSET